MKLLFLVLFVGMAAAQAQSAEEWVTLSKVDGAFKNFTNYIWLKQSNYWNAHFHYWQGLPTISRAPTNGETLTPNLLDRVAPGHHVSWNDLSFPTNKTYSSVEIQEYAAPGAVSAVPPVEGWETNEPPFALNITSRSVVEDGVTNTVTSTNWCARDRFGFVVYLRVKPVSNVWIRAWGIGPEDRNFGWRAER